MAKPVVITEEEFNKTRLELIKAASEGNLITYSSLALEKDSCQHSHLKKVLEAISLFEYKGSRPLLCAIVVSKNDLKKGGTEPRKSFQVFCEKYSIPTNAKTHQKECFEKWGGQDFRNQSTEIDRIIENSIKFKDFLKVLDIK